jgi:hypothetical protein
MGTISDKEDKNNPLLSSATHDGLRVCGETKMHSMWSYTPAERDGFGGGASSERCCRPTRPTDMLEPNVAAKWRKPELDDELSTNLYLADTCFPLGIGAPDSAVTKLGSSRSLEAAGDGKSAGFNAQCDRFERTSEDDEHYDADSFNADQPRYHALDPKGACSCGNAVCQLNEKMTKITGSHFGPWLVSNTETSDSMLPGANVVLDRKEMISVGTKIIPEDGSKLPNSESFHGFTTTPIEGTMLINRGTEGRSVAGFSLNPLFGEPKDLTVAGASPKRYHLGCGNDDTADDGMFSFATRTPSLRHSRAAAFSCRAISVDCPPDTPQPTAVHNITGGPPITASRRQYPGSFRKSRVVHGLSVGHPPLALQPVVPPDPEMNLQLWSSMSACATGSGLRRRVRRRVNSADFMGP